MDATLEHKGTHESFTVDTIQGIDGYDLSNGDEVCDVPALKAAIAKAIQSDHGVS